MSDTELGIREAQALLKQAGATIRALHEENTDLREKVASNERDARITKIATEMEEKGLMPDLTFEEKVAGLRASKDLEVKEEAIKMAAPQGLDLGSLSEQPGGSDGSGFESYIITGDDPSE